jgi:hypothetical protein
MLIVAIVSTDHTRLRLCHSLDVQTNAQERHLFCYTIQQQGKAQSTHSLPPATWKENSEVARLRTACEPVVSDQANRVANK